VSVTYPIGFRAAGVAAGLKPSGKPDLALLIGDEGTTAAGAFTTNAPAAAPVRLSEGRLRAGGGRAAIVNSGQANAGTGARGERDAIATTEATAKLLRLDPLDVLQCSTGVIGEPLHVERMLLGLSDVIDALASDGGDAFARAILTTDTVPKCARADAGPYRVGGAAKGVGMISPHLATMLAFVTTDAPVTRAELLSITQTELVPRFNAMTVDGCTSTNDTVLLFASGAVGDERIAGASDARDELAAGVAAVGDDLVSQLIRDAEGGGHVVIVQIEGASDEAAARSLAKAVADSPLVKTAAFGGDPNPGRVLQAVGAAGVKLDPALLDVWIGETMLVRGGTIPPSYFEDADLRSAARGAMAAPEFTIRVRVGDGPAGSRAFGCDLSYGYVRINGEYTT
jgi:glutamate N-acetyltransferase / amino-acid N-acetyltransferase